MPTWGQPYLNFETAPFSNQPALEIPMELLQGHPKQLTLSGVSVGQMPRLATFV